MQLELVLSKIDFAVVDRIPRVEFLSHVGEIGQAHPGSGIFAFIANTESQVPISVALNSAESIGYCSSEAHTTVRIALN